MTYEQLVKANATIKTMDFRGKQYAEVNQRVKAFRSLFPEGFIRTEIVSLTDGLCVMRAYVGFYDVSKNGTQEVLLATGTAYEKEGTSNINKTSYIENCETSAIGRALGIMGLGIDTSIASAEEVENAVSQQEGDKKIDDVKVATLVEQAKKNEVPVEYLLEGYKVESLSDLTVTQFMTIGNNWKKIAESWRRKNASERND